MFKRSGKIVDRTTAWKKGLWYGQFNIWIIKRKPVPAIVYQKRSPDIGWAPNKLDVAIGGHFEDGEDFESAVKTESLEELGFSPEVSKFVFIGKKLAANRGAFDNSVRNVVIDIYLLENEARLTDYKVFDTREVFGLCEIAVSDLLGLFSGKIKKLKTQFLRNDGEIVKDEITNDSFPENWDNYQQKMVRLIDRYFRGEKFLEY